MATVLVRHHEVVAVSSHNTMIQGGGVTVQVFAAAGNNDTKDNIWHTCTNSYPPLVAPAGIKKSRQSQPAAPPALEEEEVDLDDMMYNQNTTTMSLEDHASIIIALVEDIQTSEGRMALLHYIVNACSLKMASCLRKQYHCWLVGYLQKASSTTSIILSLSTSEYLAVTPFLPPGPITSPSSPTVPAFHITSQTFKLLLNAVLAEFQNSMISLSHEADSTSRERLVKRFIPAAKALKALAYSEAIRVYLNSLPGDRLPAPDPIHADADELVLNTDNTGDLCTNWLRLLVSYLTSRDRLMHVKYPMKLEINLVYVTAPDNQCATWDEVIRNAYQAKADTIISRINDLATCTAAGGWGIFRPGHSTVSEGRFTGGLHCEAVLATLIYSAKNTEEDMPSVGFTREDFININPLIGVSKPSCPVCVQLIYILFSGQKPPFGKTKSTHSNFPTCSLPEELPLWAHKAMLDHFGELLRDVIGTKLRKSVEEPDSDTASSDVSSAADDGGLVDLPKRNRKVKLKRNRVEYS